jgi:hypothetical protein
MSGDKLDRWRAAVQRNDQLKEETMTETSTEEKTTEKAPTRAEIETAVRGVLLPKIVPAGQVLDGPSEWVVSEAIQDMICRVAAAVFGQPEQR